VGLQIVARALPLTYSVEALRAALAAFATLLFALAVRALALRLD
jgi:hypothetical protein